MAVAVTDAIQCIGKTTPPATTESNKIVDDKENNTLTTNTTTASDDVTTSTDTIMTTTTTEQLQRPLDLHRVEILSMQHRSTSGLESKFVNGIVLDHGSRHPDMPSSLHNVYVMICNISLEYEQAETAAGFVYSTASERETLVESERKWLDERCRKIIHFKRSVCNSTDGNDSSNTKKTFCIINQKGVDPLSLDMFAKEGILCLRRAKRRNMERLSLATSGQVILSLEDLDPKMLGYCDHVYEETYGDDKYTFVEGCIDAQSCTLLIQGPNQLTIDQITDAVKDGLRAVKNAVEDNAVVPGGGAFELAASLYLTNEIVPKTLGKAKLGVMAFAEALLIIPKTLIANSGYDVQDALLQLKDEYMANNISNNSDMNSPTMAIGFNCTTGEPMLPVIEGVFDNVRVKRQSLHLATVLANQLLLVDEVMRAGKSMGQQPSQQQPSMDDM
jgi:T-complex protein 1 subunit zeta